jgi:hypothetical protein
MFDDIALPIIRQVLIDNMSFYESEIITHIDEKMLAKHGGKRQVNVYPDSIIPGPSEDQHVGQEFVSSFNIGMTLRVGKIPEHKMFSYAYSPDFIPVFRNILVTMRRERYTILSLINNTIEHPWKLVEPYRFSGPSVQITRVGPEHFNADTNTVDERTDYGLFVNASYGEGRYMAFVHPGAQEIQRAQSLFTATGLDDTISFVNASYGTEPLVYLWDFGNGSTSTVRDPGPETYTITSTFLDVTITLSVTGPDGYTSISSQVVRLTNPNPVGNLELVTLTLPDLDDLDIDETDDLEVQR